MTHLSFLLSLASSYQWARSHGGPMPMSRWRDIVIPGLLTQEEADWVCHLLCYTVTATFYAVSCMVWFEALRAVDVWLCACNDSNTGQTFARYSYLSKCHRVHVSVYFVWVYSSPHSSSVILSTDFWQLFIPRTEEEVWHPGSCCRIFSGVAALLTQLCR